MKINREKGVGVEKNIQDSSETSKTSDEFDEVGMMHGYSCFEDV